MKIGFYSHNFNVLGKYWENLKDIADCWWGVPDPKLNDLLIEKKIKNIVFCEEKFEKDLSVKKGHMYRSTDKITAQKKIAEEINPDLWIVDTANKLNHYSTKSLRVQTFHTLPLKKFNFFEPVLNYDLLLLPGKFHKEEFIKRFKNKANLEKLKIVGWPQVDDLINGSFSRDQILKDLKLDPQKKTIMYAPTWGWGNGNISLFCRNLGKEKEVFTKLCEHASKNNLNLIIRLHSLSFAAENKELIKIANKHGALWQTSSTQNFRDDPNKFLWITDILISDISGIITEFLVLDRPIIYIDPDDENNPWIDSDMPKDFRAGNIVKTFNDLKNSIDDALKNPKKFSKKRNQIKNYIYSYTSGKSTEMACNTIIEFAKNNGLK